MIRLLGVLLGSAAAAVKSRRELALENLALRHQLSVLQSTGARPRLTDVDRSLWTILCRRWRNWKQALVLVQPETVVRWHRQGFRLYWRRKSRCRRGGRPKIGSGIRALVHRMSQANPLWGAPRIHGELLKLGIGISQASVAKYMVRDRKPPSQNWRTFLENHIEDLVSIDFFTVPTATFRVLFVFVVLAHDRRRVLHFNVTEHPTAEWTSQQIVEAFPWDMAPRYLLRDRARLSLFGWVLGPRPVLRGLLGPEHLGRAAAPEGCDLAVWLSDAALDSWRAAPSGKPVGQREAAWC